MPKTAKTATSLVPVHGRSPFGNRGSERQNAARPFIDNDLGAHARQHVLQSLDVMRRRVTTGALMYSVNKAVNRAASPALMILLTGSRRLRGSADLLTVGQRITLL